MMSAMPAAAVPYKMPLAVTEDFEYNKYGQLAVIDTKNSMSADKCDNDGGQTALLYYKLALFRLGYDIENQGDWRYLVITLPVRFQRSS